MITRKLKRTYRQLSGYNCAHPPDIPSRLRLHNYGSQPAPQDFWLLRFIEARGLFPKQSVSVFSVFGHRTMITLNCSKTKIFMARENLHRNNWETYSDLALREQCIDLSLGFDYANTDSRYMRFPLWITWLLPPDAKSDDVQSFCNRIKG